MFTLICSCGSTDFHYDSESGFTCRHCGRIYTEKEAGEHLLQLAETV
jgi:hypothetical protein